MQMEWFVAVIFLSSVCLMVAANDECLEGSHRQETVA